MDFNYYNKRLDARELLPTVEDQLIDWIDCVQQPGWSVLNDWLRAGGYSVYVRSGRRNIDGNFRTTLEIASVHIDEDLRGRGWFSRFLVFAEEHSPWEILWVECVENPRLADHFRRRTDWIQVPIERDKDWPTFYKHTPGSDRHRCSTWK